MMLNDSHFQTGYGVEKAIWWLLGPPFRLARFAMRRTRR